MTDYNAKYLKYKNKYLNLKKILYTSAGYSIMPTYGEVVVITINGESKLATFLEYNEITGEVLCRDIHIMQMTFPKKYMSSMSLMKSLTKYWEFSTLSGSLKDKMLLN